MQGSVTNSSKSDPGIFFETQKTIIWPVVLNGNFPTTSYRLIIRSTWSSPAGIVWELGGVAMVEGACLYEPVLKGCQRPGSGTAKSLRPRERVCRKGVRGKS